MAEQRNIPNLDGLVALANRDGVDIKPTLLRVMTDLYVQKPRHSAEEEQHYTELALRLLDAVDPQTRAVVAGKLTSYGAPPAAVMQHLRGEDGTVIVAPAPGYRTPAAALAELCDLFLSANVEERRLILVNLEYATLPPAEPIVPAVARAAIRRLETAALSRNSAAFVQEISQTLEIAPELARRLIDDRSGEPIVVAARALSMPTDVLQRVLLCLNPSISQSVLRVYELVQLYDDIEPRSALRLLKIWRASPKPAQQAQPAPQPTPRHAPLPQASTHRPQYWHSEERPPLPARPRILWEQLSQTRRAENE